MTSSSRRAVLTALASASALAIPAVARALPPGQADAELFALQDAIEAADRRWEAALDTEARIADARRSSRPPAPLEPDPPEMDERWRRKLDELVAKARIKSLPQKAAHEEALKAWHDEIARIDVESGLSAAEERSREASAEVREIRDQIVAIRATTIAGLIFKAKYASEHYRDEPDEEIMESIVDDLLAMGGAEPAS